MSSFPWFYMAVLFGSALLGGLLMQWKARQSSQGLRLLLAFSAAYLLGLVMFHLLPELFHSELASAGWYIIGGFLLQIVLDFFSHGVEHGHAHVHQHHGTRFIVLVMVSLWIHAFIEGMPFGSQWPHLGHEHNGHQHLHVHGDSRDSMLIGIGLHKVTESFVFVSLLAAAGYSASRRALWLVLFALVAPAGAAVQYWLGSSQLVAIEEFTPRIMGVLIGILLHVSTTIIFESSEGHHFNIRKFTAILLGIAASVFAGLH